MTRGIGKLDDHAVRAIRRLVSMRDTLEFAGRPDGEAVQLSRQEWEDLLDGFGVVSRAIVSLASGV